MKKILIVSGGMNTGGAEKWLLDFSRNIDNSKFELSFLFHSRDTQFYEHDLKEMNVKVFRILSKNPLKYLKELRRIILDNNIDIVHSHVNHFSSLVSLVKLFVDVKIVVHAHNDLTYMVRKSSLLKKLYYKVSERIIPVFSDLMIPVSTKAHDSLFKHSHNTISKVKKIYCGIDTSHIDSSIVKLDVNDGFSQFEEQIEFNNLNRYIFHVGRFVEQKNHNFILDIADKCQQLDKDIVFVLIGDGPLKDKVISDIRSRNLYNVKIISKLKDAPCYLFKYADYMILPSHHEGLPIVLMESQYINLKAIVSDKVTREACLNMDLIKYVSIDDGDSVDIWVDFLINNPVLSSREINESFKLSKFDILASVESHQKLYSSF